MHARVLLTNGTRTVDMLWVEHKGRDVSWGIPRRDWHGSYHASGQVHHKWDGERHDVGRLAPLADLKGYFHFSTLTVGDRKWLDAVDPDTAFSNAKADALITVDLRTVPDGMMANVGIGLLEAGNFAALPMLEPIVLGTQTITSKQIIISTAVTPWFVAQVSWTTPAT